MPVNLYRQPNVVTARCSTQNTREHRSSDTPRNSNRHEGSTNWLGGGQNFKAVSPLTALSYEALLIVCLYTSVQFIVEGRRGSSVVLSSSTHYLYGARSLVSLPDFVVVVVVVSFDTRFRSGTDSM